MGDRRKGDGREGDGRKRDGETGRRETGGRQGVWRQAGRRETGRRETGRQNHRKTEDVVSSVAKPETVLRSGSGSGSTLKGQCHENFVFN